MKQDLAELKCRDCEHCVLSGWWDPQKVCDLDGWPIDPNGSACISVQPKTKPRTR